MNSQRKDSGRGWWHSATWQIESAKHKRGLSDAEWEAMGWEERSRCVAYVRALDTMAAWEDHVANEERKRAERKARARRR